MFRGKIVSTFLEFKTKKFLTILLLVLLLVCIPQINLTSYPQSTIISKFIVFIYFCIVLFGISILWVFKSKVTNLSISRIDIVLVVLLIYIVANRYVLQTDYSFSIRFNELLGVGFLYLIFRTLKIRAFYWLLLAIVISGIVQAVYGNLQLLGYCPSNHSGFKLTGSFFNPGPYAGFLSCIWSLSLGMYLFRGIMIHKFITYFGKINKRLFEVISLLGIVTTTLVIPATRSRAAILAIIISGGFLLMIKYRVYSRFIKKTSKYKKNLLLFSLATILIVVLFAGFQLKQESANGRLLIWKISKNIIADNPFFGVGFDKFKAHYMNYQADYFLLNKNPDEIALAGNSKYAFNEFIQLTVENGIFGLVFLVIIIYLIFSLKLRHNCRHLEYLAKGSILSIVIFAFFSYPTQILPIKLILIVSLALIAVLDKDKRPINIFNKQKKHFFYKGILMLSGSFIIFFTCIRTFQLVSGFKIWKEASHAYNNMWFKESVEKYESTADTFWNNGEFLGEYGQALSVNQEHQKAIEYITKAKKYYNNNTLDNTLGNSYKALKQYKKSEEAYIRSSNMVPSLFYPNYLLAKLYDDSGQKYKALNKANKILEKDIKIPSKAIDEIKEEMEIIVKKHELKTSGL